MKCDDARLQMNSAIDGEISQDNLSKLNDHLDHCEQCTVEYEELKYLKELMGEIEMKELPKEFESELHLKLIEERRLIQNNKEKVKKPSPMGKVINMFKGHGNYVVAAAAVALIVLLSNNPLKIAGYQTFNAKSESSPMYVTTEMATEDSAMAYPAEAPAPDMAKFGAAGTRGADTNEMENAGFAVQATTITTSKVDNAPGYRKDRMIIKSGNINIEIVNYDEVVSDLKQKAIEWGGYIENESTSKQGYNLENDLKNGSLIIRIPNEKFEEMMALLKGYGNVIYDNVYAQDVTKEYRDTAQEVENFKLTEERFRELLKTASDMKDVLAIENELTRIRSQINQYERQLKDWEVLVDLSSISVDIREVKSLKPVIEPIDDSLFGKAKAEFIQTINGLRLLLENVFIWIVANSPILIILGFGVIVWWRKTKKKSV